MEPTLRILITIPDDQHFIVIGGEFDMAITLFLDGVEGANLVFAGVPDRIRMLLSSVDVRTLRMNTWATEFRRTVVK